MNDWTGNSKSVSAKGGFDTGTRTEHDYYATHPNAVEMLLKIEDFDKNTLIWENAAGEGHLAGRMVELVYKVVRTDLILRKQLDESQILQLDFLKGELSEYEPSEELFNIITNPPYKFSQQWIEKSMSLLADGQKLALFLPISFLESDKRKPLFQKYPPKVVHVSSNRIPCGKNGKFAKSGSAVCYSWFIWQKGYAGRTELKWFN